MEYQPRNKSFEYYISIGYKYASGKEMNKDELIILRGISNIDTSIIKIDDILDNEEIRNGNICIHLVDGIEETIINAKLDEINGVHSITNLIKLRKLFPEFSYEILKIFNNNYLRGIYEGQKIDKELENLPINKIDLKTINLYFSMITKFTGGHVRYGLEIGQLLAGKFPDKNLSLIGELIGINRQIIDDFNDYFKIHHNPFGDIKRGAKRLPEILFTIDGGDRSMVLRLIDEKKFDDVIKLVLSKKNREKMYFYCEENIKKIEKIESNFNYKDIYIDYSFILEKNV